MLAGRRCAVEGGQTGWHGMAWHGWPVSHTPHVTNQPLLPSRPPPFSVSVGAAAPGSAGTARQGQAGQEASVAGLLHCAAGVLQG
jgi:hypothetical protein